MMMMMMIMTTTTIIITKRSLNAYYVPGTMLTLLYLIIEEILLLGISTVILDPTISCIPLREEKEA